MSQWTWSWNKASSSRQNCVRYENARYGWTQRNFGSCFGSPGFAKYQKVAITFFLDFDIWFVCSLLKICIPFSPSPFFSTILQLKELGALLPTTTIITNEHKERVYKNDDGDLTVLGELVASMPIDVTLGKV